MVSGFFNKETQMLIRQLMDNYYNETIQILEEELSALTLETQGTMVFYERCIELVVKKKKLNKLKRICS